MGKRRLVRPESSDDEDDSAEHQQQQAPSGRARQKSLSVAPAPSVAAAGAVTDAELTASVSPRKLRLQRADSSGSSDDGLSLSLVELASPPGTDHDDNDGGKSGHGGRLRRRSSRNSVDAQNPQQHDSGVPTETPAYGFRPRHRPGRQKRLTRKRSPSPQSPLDEDGSDEEEENVLVVARRSGRSGSDSENSGGFADLSQALLDTAEGETPTHTEKHRRKRLLRRPSTPNSGTSEDEDVRASAAAAALAALEPVRQRPRRERKNKFQDALERLKMKKRARVAASPTESAADAASPAGDGPAHEEDGGGEEEEAEHSDVSYWSDNEDFVVADDYVEQSEVIHCKCGATDNQGGYKGLWIQCTSELCEAWQHAACYGYKSGDKIPRDFLCDRCSAMQPDHVHNEEELDTAALELAQNNGMFEAAAAGDIDTLRQLLSEPECDIDWQNPAAKAQTALHVAASEGHLEVVRLLIRAQAAQHIDLDNMLPIGYAVNHGHLDVVHLLLSTQMGDLLTANAKGDNLLHMAAELESADVLGVLFNSPYRDEFVRAVNVLDEEGLPPIARAARCGLEDNFKVLSAVPDVNLAFTTEHGATLIHHAAHGGNAGIIRRLLQKLPIGLAAAPDLDGCPPLFYAVRRGHDDAIKLLLDSGAPVFCRDLIGISGLHIAAAEGHASTVQLLIDRGHPVDCLDDCSWPPLLYANFEANEGCVLNLLRAKPEQLAELSRLRGLSKISQSLQERTRRVLKTAVVALATQDVYYRFLNDFIRSEPSLLDNEFAFLLDYKGLLDLDNRLLWFRRKIAEAPCSQPIALEMIRGHEVECAASRFKEIPSERLLTATFLVTFANEPGTCLGPRREAFHNICKGLASPDLQIFQECKGDHSAVVFPQALFSDKGEPGCPLSFHMHDRLDLLFFAGQFVAVALVINEHIPLKFSRPFLKQVLTDNPVGMEDLEVVDFDFHKSLKWVLENDITNVLDNTFSHEVKDVLGLPHEIPLDPSGKRGANDDVTEENKREYVDLMVKFLVTTSVSAEIQAFKNGLFSVLPFEKLPFSPNEFSLLLNGVDQLNPEEWRQNTVYHGYCAKDEVIVWFWKLVRDMTNQERALLLQFATGTSSLPMGGFAALQGLQGETKFTISRACDPTALPTASTCFNLLKLPPYGTEADLRSKVLVAVRYGSQGFEFT